MISTLLAIALHVSGDAAPPSDSPWYVAAAIEAVAVKDAKAIDLNFGSIKELTDHQEIRISAAEAITLLSVCSQSGTRQLMGATYTIDYKCPTRRAAAKGCDSGDLFVMVGVDDRGSSFIVSHRRKYSAECPLFVPQAPPPGWNKERG